MFPVVQIGPLAIQTHGLILLVALWIGLRVSEHYALKKGGYPDLIYNLVFVALIGGIIGARMGFIAAYPDIFVDYPSSIFSLNPGLLDIWSGLAVGIIAALIYGTRRKLNFWFTVDLLSPAIGILLTATSLANLASGNGYGAPASIPWAIELWGGYRHPSQIYEAIAGAAVVWMIWPGKRLGDHPIAGMQVLFLTILYSAARLFLEAFRGDSTTIIGGIRSGQVMYWTVLATSLWLAGKFLCSTSQTSNYQSDSQSQS
jgi:phosphatidylglycerol---prolipoprotein diacylglyceryl transferase